MVAIHPPEMTGRHGSLSPPIPDLRTNLEGQRRFQTATIGLGTECACGHRRWRANANWLRDGTIGISTTHVLGD